jgi:F0F1-type ATP synthase alpha subunit
MVLVSKRIKGIFSTYRIYAGLAKIGGEDGDIMLHVNRGERLMAFFTQSLYETYSFYKQVVRLYALTIDSTDVILPSRISMFFTLFGLKQFNYIKNIEKRLVTFFMDTKTIEPLLIVSSSESILPEITLLINHFRNFFETDIQNNTSPEAASLISELVARTRAQENA